MTRRDEVAQAAMELVAEGGSRALTHRRIDRRLGFPEGTTSNYARTRRDLVMMVAQHIASIANLRDPAAPPPRTVEEAVEQLVIAFEKVAARGTDIRARMALTIDCQDDPELYALLTTDSPVRATITQQARELLDDLGVMNSEQRAIDLIALMNGLFYDRLIGYGVRGMPADPAAVLRAWLTGLLSEQRSGRADGG
ncbi:MAG TPA: hypothetical protein VK086_08940 [Ruania sp.]|nr:hypothetical protein [Ruania sp.]